MHSIKIKKSSKNQTTNLSQSIGDGELVPGVQLSAVPGMKPSSVQTGPAEPS